MSRQESSRKGKDRKKLSRPNVIIRVRPQAEYGGHQEADDRLSVEKRLHSWTEDTISIEDSHQVREYTFPTKVISPEASPEESYKSLLPPLMEKLLKPPLID